MQWFVVHTITGHEQKVKKLLQKMIKEKQLENSFGRIVIPVENLVQVRKGKKVIEERRLYPGYIVLEMEGNDENLRLVNSISGVTHFLGSKSKPIPLEQHEVDALLEQVAESKENVMTLAYRTEKGSLDIPPIDAAAPVRFETASFGLG